MLVTKGSSDGIRYGGRHTEKGVRVGGEVDIGGSDIHSYGNFKVQALVRTRRCTYCAMRPRLTRPLKSRLTAVDLGQQPMGQCVGDSVP